MHKVQRVDNNIVELKGDTLYLNDQQVSRGAEEELKDTFYSIIKGLKESDYDYHEYVIENEDYEEQDISQFYLLREYRNGKIDDLEYADERSELMELVKKD